MTITGHKKDLIITAAGKNVAPAVLEDRLRAHWLVSQCLVVGDARPYIGRWWPSTRRCSPVKADNGRPPTAAAQTFAANRFAGGDPGGHRRGQQRGTQAEAIKMFAILGRLHRGGRLADTHAEAARHVIMEQYANQIAALYDDRLLAALCQVPMSRWRAGGR